MRHGAGSVVDGFGAADAARQFPRSRPPRILKGIAALKRNGLPWAALVSGLCLITLPSDAAFAQSPGVRLMAPPAKTMSLGVPTVKPGSKEEVEYLLKNAPKSSEYPNAAHAFLLDLEDIVVREDGSSRKVVRSTKKIFNRRGRDEEAEVKIGYNSHFQTFQLIRARTIRPDGTVADVKPEDIRTSRPSDYDDYEVVAFSMPAVEDDCIIDYEYVIDEKESLMAGQFWTSWYFQGGFDPVMLTRLTITVPKRFKLGERVINSAVKPTTKDTPDGKATVYTWEDNNVPVLELEPMMPAAEKVLPTLFVSTVPTWQSIADWYQTLAKDRMDADPTIKAKTAEVIKGRKTPEDKARAIFYYVQEKTRYVAIELGKSAYQPRTAPSVLANKYGDCKDMATLLVAMMREAGITAYPVLLEMGDRSKKSEEIPSPGAFNHAIALAEINGKKYWLDATASLCPFGVIPGSDRGCEAFVIRDGKGAFETIPYGTPDDNRFDRIVRLKMNPDGSASGSVTFSGTGDVDMALRSALRELPEAKRGNYGESLCQSIGASPRVTGVRVSDYQDMDTPVFITFDVTFQSWGDLNGDLFLFKARPDQMTGNTATPFRLDARKFAVQQEEFSAATSTLELTLPAGFTVLNSPKDADIKGDLGRFVRTAKQEGNKLTIVTRNESFRADVPPARYQEVKDYYKAFTKANDESVILKKTE
jgi:hypothetical protein